MKSIRTIFFATIFMAGAVAAYSKDGDALPFMRIVRDPASAAMGFAGTASSSTIAYSSFRNPSVIPFYGKTADAAFSYQSWAPDGVKSGNYNLGTGVKLLNGRFGLALGGAYQKGQEYKIVNESGISAGAFTPKEMLINFGVGVLVTETLSAGANVRYASEKTTSDDKLSTVCTDFLITWHRKAFNVSAGISSLGSSVKDSEDNDFGIPSSATVAGDFDKVFGDAHGVKVGADADYFFSGNFTFAMGAQYSWKDMLFLRAGFHYGNDDAVLPTFATAGAGIKFKGIRLEAGWLTGSKALKNTLTFGLGVSF